MLSALNRVDEDRYQRLGDRFFEARYDGDIRDFEPPVSPFKVIWIDPKQIRYYSDRTWTPWKHQRFAHGKVLAGRWDKRSRRFDSSAIYQALRERFVEGNDWSEISYIEDARRRIERGSSAWHCETKEELQARCRTVDDLYENIASGGYRTQRELIRDESVKHLLESWKDPERTIPLEDLADTISLEQYYSSLNDHPNGSDLHLLKMYLDEVRVDIARNGSYRFVDGRNRLSLAKIAGIDEIPAVVVVRHEQWMETLAKGYKQHRLPDHPDTVELRADE